VLAERATLVFTSYGGGRVDGRGNPRPRLTARSPIVS
jgi:hypothetical protein